MPFSKEKPMIMMRKELILITPSIKLNPTVGRTGCRYPRTEFHVRRAADSDASEGAGVTACGEPELVELTEALGAHPTATKIAFVKSKGAAINSSTLKIKANTIELAAAAVPPFFNSSFDRFFLGIGNKPGTPPVIPAKSPSPSITAGVNATSISAASASCASAKASLAE